MKIGDRFKRKSAFISEHDSELVVITDITINKVSYTYKCNDLLNRHTIFKDQFTLSTDKYWKKIPHQYACISKYI